MPAVLITRERTARVRDVYVAVIPEDALARLRSVNRPVSDEDTDEILEPYASTTLLAAPTEIMEVDAQDLKIRWELVPNLYEEGDE